MKAALSGKIEAIHQIMDKGESVVEIGLVVSGKIDSDKASGKEVSAKVVLHVKPIYAERLRFGQVIHFDLHTDE